MLESSLNQEDKETKEPMRFFEEQPTTRQLVIFTVVLSFIVSIIGTVLALGVIGPLFGVGEGGTASPFVFNRPKILEKITEPGAIIRPEELIVKVVEEASQAVVSVVAAKDVPVIEQFFVDPFADDPLFRQFFGDGGSGFQIPQFRQKGTRKEEVSSGSGFIVSPDGTIITNKHVVFDASADYTVLANDGRKLPAKVLARDPLNDLAILKIEGKDLPVLRLGNSAGVRIGETAIAIGNALGEFKNTVSVGVVSGLSRSVVASGGAGGSELLQELIQTDAAINPGNSGGPLLNIRGEVIGINTAMAQGAENIGFAIPIAKARRDLDSLQTHGKIIYPFLGVRYLTLTGDISREKKYPRDYGALVIKGDNGEPAVVPGSPADTAALKEGDILLELNGRLINFEHTLGTLLQNYKVGDEVSLKVLRDGKEFEVRVKLEERK